MPGWIAAHGLTVLGGVFLIVAAIETHAPMRASPGVALRWLTNIGLYIVTLLAVQAVPRSGLPSLFGPWNAEIVGAVVIFPLTFLVLDLQMYVLHRIQHLGPFWRFHHVHHADHELDASTGLRHHPGEAVINALLGGSAMTLLGSPFWVAPIYVLVAELASLAQHANIALPPRFDRRLSLVLVTPGTHRLHHSDDKAYHDTNYGSLLTVWDRAFGTWHEPVEEALRYGVSGVGRQGPLDALLAPLRWRRSSSESPPSAIRR